MQALRRPEVRGQWGELTLKRIAELAGMINHCDFYEQQQSENGDSRMRPDMIVRMPDQRELIIDAKTPLDAYINATQTNDENMRTSALVKHARNVRERMRELASKAIGTNLNIHHILLCYLSQVNNFLRPHWNKTPNS